MSNLSEEDIQKELERAANQISDRIADNMKTFGVSSTVGRLLGIIYMNRAPMTLDELAEETGMSKTRMSQVMRQMISLNIAEKEFVKGSRKEHYNVESNYVQTFISLFTTNWREVVSKNSLLAKRLQDKIAHVEQVSKEDFTPETQAKMDDLKQELDDWIHYYDWIQRLVEVFESGKIFDLVPVEPPDKSNHNQGGHIHE
ncbi:DNA-binding transcriptional regulator GbsR, MarR family [Alteribacillus persepolensis]|uniref:HTH-type transcriptional regulator n=1 Tax=Alteribacillus persepolensis TaxID=568899 RepID=A0A1G8ITQ3_9BACI|nr:GbsR/MarR family transcriptional regulator [Alteribacillus persepolensis]SDI22354.1 DNA-binding transcriptional regulator GbsR, MarR family [Alteribacillus persepolensis]